MDQVTVFAPTIREALPEVVSPKQVAQYLGVCLETVYRMMRRPVFPKPFKLPGSRVWRWRSAELLAFLEEQGRASDAS